MYMEEDFLAKTLEEYIYNIYCVYNVYIKEDFWAQTLGQYVLYILCI